MRAIERLSIKEAAALAGLSERAIRNEIERGVIRVERRSRGQGSAVALPRGAVLYFRLLKDVRVKLPRADRSALYHLLADERGESGAWRRDRHVLRRGPLVLDARAIRGDVERELRAYETGRHKVVAHPDTLGGEPVFAGTRVAVRHVGKLALRGVPASEIKADYPALGDDDIAFAAVFARMKPGPGRPRRLRFRRAAA